MVMPVASTWLVLVVVIEAFDVAILLAGIVQFEELAVKTPLEPSKASFVPVTTRRVPALGIAKDQAAPVQVAMASVWPEKLPAGVAPPNAATTTVIPVAGLPPVPADVLIHEQQTPMVVLAFVVPE